MPCSQGRGVFQGRADLFSGSGPMHPEVRPNARLAKRIAKKERMALANERIKLLTKQVTSQHCNSHTKTKENDRLLIDNILVSVCHELVDFK